MHRSGVQADRELLDLVFDLPADRLALATESPACLPAALGGGRRSNCEPWYAPLVAARAAEIRPDHPAGPADLARTLHASALRFLDLPPPATEPEPKPEPEPAPIEPSTVDADAAYAAQLHAQQWDDDEALARAMQAQFDEEESDEDGGALAMEALSLDS